RGRCSVVSLAVWCLYVLLLILRQVEAIGEYLEPRVLISVFAAWRATAAASATSALRVRPGSKYEDERQGRQHPNRTTGHDSACHCPPPLCAPRPPPPRGGD